MSVQSDGEHALSRIEQDEVVWAGRCISTSVGSPAGRSLSKMDFRSQQVGLLFATFRLKSTSNPLRITVKTRPKLTVNIHSETLSWVRIVS